ncbi:MAG TPA: hypothetical protein VLK34_05095 [Nocardioidaceae bacterium]|nr:hypothetical protein [Nocardioidaceae bacterium]
MPKLDHPASAAIATARFICEVRSRQFVEAEKLVEYGECRRSSEFASQIERSSERSRHCDGANARHVKRIEVPRPTCDAFASKPVEIAKHDNVDGRKKLEISVSECVDPVQPGRGSVTEDAVRRNDQRRRTSAVLNGVWYFTSLVHAGEHPSALAGRD